MLLLGLPMAHLECSKLSSCFARPLLAAIMRSAKKDYAALQIAFGPLYARKCPNAHSARVPSDLHHSMHSAARVSALSVSLRTLRTCALLSWGSWCSREH